MLSTILFYSFLYSGVAMFAAGCAVRIWRYAKAPVHLRWELYPIPKGRTGEFKVMIPEILLLKSLRESNRSLWYRSFPFHIGLYLLVVSVVFLLIALTAPRLGPRFLHDAYFGSGCAGLVLALGGALGLLWRRLADRELRNYTTPGDLFNLFLFATTLALLLVEVVLPPAQAPGVLAVLRGAAVFDMGLRVPTVLMAGVISGSVLLAYMPMTFMAHFIGKYFTYHEVRWDDASAPRGSVMEKRIAGYLLYQPSWGASHVGADGTRTWGDIAMANPTKGKSK